MRNAARAGFLLGPSVAAARQQLQRTALTSCNSRVASGASAAAAASQSVGGGGVCHSSISQPPLQQQQQQLLSRSGCCSGSASYPAAAPDRPEAAARCANASLPASCQQRLPLVSPQPWSATFRAGGSPPGFGILWVATNSALGGGASGLQPCQQAACLFTASQAAFSNRSGSLAAAAAAATRLPGPTVLELEMAAAAAAEAEEVVEVRRGGAAFAVLNRPKALNALNTSMVVRLRELYERWEQDPRVNVVVTKSDGRAYCAGGDVRGMYLLAKEGKFAEAKQFFRREYKVNYVLATLKRPHVAIINGIVMGGGNGISMHGTFRVVSEKAVFAMPETAIGLHPDVGASYFLPRLPGYCGEYLALTGARLKAADMLALGLATHFVPSDRLPALEERLSVLRCSDPESVDLAISEYAEMIPPREQVVARRQEVLDRCFQNGTVEEIIIALEKAAHHARGLLGQSPTSSSSTTTTTTTSSSSSTGGSSGSSGGGSAMDEGAAATAKLTAAEAEEVEADAVWCEETLKVLRQMSPTSLKVSLRSMRLGRRQSMAVCLSREFRLSAHAVMQTTSSDFVEGVRALLVDKDNNPKWSPATLAEVTPAMVDAHFQHLHGDGEELRLPVKQREQWQAGRSRM